MPSLNYSSLAIVIVKRMTVTKNSNPIDKRDLVIGYKHATLESIVGWDTGRSLQLFTINKSISNMARRRGKTLFGLKFDVIYGCKNLIQTFEKTVTKWEFS